MLPKLKSKRKPTLQSLGYKFGFESFVAGISYEETMRLAVKQFDIHFERRALGKVSMGWIMAQRRTEQNRTTRLKRLIMVRWKWCHK